MHPAGAPARPAAQWHFNTAHLDPRVGRPRPAASSTELLHPLSPADAGPLMPPPSLAIAHVDPPPSHLMPVLAQLLTGATDVTASQRLGMSPRTFSRRVSELLEHLGVLSRFQAGVASVNHGWLVHRRAGANPLGRPER